MQYNQLLSRLHSANNSLQEFKRMLEESGASKTTVKNYLSDVRSFLSSEEPAKPLSYATVKRRNSAIKRYLIFKNSKRSTYLPLALSVFGLVGISVLSFNSFRNNKEVLAEPYQKFISLPSDTTINSSETVIGNGELKLVVKLEPQVSEVYGLPAEMNIPLQTKTSPISSNGFGLIPQGQKEVLIVNSLISEDSYIYLTPYSPTEKQALYVKEQEDGFAIIAIEDSLDWDLKFQWKVDNTEVYHSIY